MRRLDDEAVRVRRPRDEVLNLGIVQHAITVLASVAGMDREGTLRPQLVDEGRLDLGLVDGGRRRRGCGHGVFGGWLFVLGGRRLQSVACGGSVELAVAVGALGG